MRKLVLTNFKAKTGNYEFEDYRLVVVNHNEGETETDMLLKASRAFTKDFPVYFPGSELLSVGPLPTWGADPMPVEKPDSALHFTNFHSMDEHPGELEGQGFTDDVLIDVDGNRKTFRVGYYDTENDTWHLYVKSDDATIDLMYLQEALWCHLPLIKNDKSWKKDT